MSEMPLSAADAPSTQPSHFADQSPSASPRFGPPASASRKFASFLNRLGKRGFWPLADQGVASLGNILTIFLLGRGLSKPEFGTFTLLLEAMFFLVSMHAAVVTYPLTVKGAIADKNKLRHLATASLQLTLLLAVPLSLAAIALAGAFHMFAIGLIAIVALVSWQMQEAVRRALMAHFRHGQAIWGDAVNYLGQAAVLLALLQTGRLTLMTGLGAMAITTILALIIQTLQVGVARVQRGELIAIAKDFWISGRWVAMTNLGGLCMMICGNWALGLAHGREQIADFAAIAALLKICNPMVQTVSGLITPSAAKALDSGGIVAARRIALKITAMGALLLSPVLLLLTITPHWCLWLAYHGRYDRPEHAMALRFLVYGNVITFLIAAASSYLNGIHRTRFSFYGQLAGNISMFAVLLPMIVAYGWMGYVLGGLVQVTLQLGVLLWFLRRANAVAASTP